MTNNRFHFGIGVSPWYEDFLATGERWEKRGKRMDEQIDISKVLWMVTTLDTRENFTTFRSLNFVLSQQNQFQF